MYKSERNGFCPQLVILVFTSKTHHLHTLSKQPVNKVCSLLLLLFAKAFVCYFLPKSPHSLPGGRGFNQAGPGVLAATIDGKAPRHRPFWVVLPPAGFLCPHCSWWQTQSPSQLPESLCRPPRWQDTSRMVTAFPTGRHETLAAHRFIFCFWTGCPCSLCRRKGDRTLTRDSRGRARSRRF